MISLLDRIAEFLLESFLGLAKYLAAIVPRLLKVCFLISPIVLLTVLLFLLYGKLAGAVSAIVVVILVLVGFTQRSRENNDALAIGTLIAIVVVDCLAGIAIYKKMRTYSRETISTEKTINSIAIDEQIKGKASDGQITETESSTSIKFSYPENPRFEAYVNTIKKYRDSDGRLQYEDVDSYENTILSINGIGMTSSIPSNLLCEILERSIIESKACALTLCKDTYKSIITNTLEAIRSPGKAHSSCCSKMFELEALSPQYHGLIQELMSDEFSVIH